MHRTVRCCSCMAVLLALAAAQVVEAGAELEALEIALGVLPAVDRFEVDAGGHLTLLEGDLTPGGPSPPRRAAVAFMKVHQRLFSAAEGSVFRTTQIAESGGQTSVLVRQEVGGFLVVDEALWLTFDTSGVLGRVAGWVLQDDDLRPGADEALSRGRAVEMALATVGAPSTAAVSGALRVVVGGRRCWLVALQIEEHGKPRAVTVTLDGYNGEVVDVTRNVLDTMPAIPWPEPQPEGELAITACTPMSPPPGEFGSLSGQQLWTWSGGGCGSWTYDWDRGASLLHGNCLEYDCDPYPATDSCNHGQIDRGDLALDAGYERAQVEALTPDRELFMRLRWGPSSLEAAPFVVPAGAGGTTIVEVNVDVFGTWDSAKVRELTLELVDDRMIWLESLELLPGPWLELARGPELAPATPGDPLVSGESVTVLQNVRNLGCRLEAGTHEEMRALRYDLYEQVGLLKRFDSTVCEDAEIPGAIPPESAVRGLPMCEFLLPEAGTWQLEARFDSHPMPSAASSFIVQPAIAPDLAIDRETPVDLYSGALGLWPCRSDLLDRGRYDDPNPPCSLPFVIAVGTVASGLTEPVTSEIEAWLRPRDPAANPGVCDPDSGGWYSVGEPVSRDFALGTSGPIELQIERARAMALPISAEGWSLVDLKVVVAPVSGEVDTENNRLCISSWLPVADAELGSVMGPTWVDDDYFLEPEHWPPNGLAWTGLTLDHEEGSSSYDPDSALAVLSVEDGANEPPRVIWFEQLAGRSVAGLILRYRRSEAGYGGPPYLEAGAAEDDGVSQLELDVPGHPNRTGLVADAQWRTVVWRRGDLEPFGAYPVPQLVAPGTSGSVLSLHVAPDRNCSIDEPDCSSGVYPETMLDVVGVWYADGSPTFEPLFISEGLRVRLGDEWVQVPATVVPGQIAIFGIQVRNVGTATGVADLTAAVEIRALNDSPILHVMTGSEVVPIGVGESHVLPLDPPWQPFSAGMYGLAGQIWESGDEIGRVYETVEVIEGGSGCPVPLVSLP